MDSNFQSDIDSIRKSGISRRGGVRVRGGRLPPIRLRNTPIATNSKKVFTPNIPQRRIKVKEEIPEPVVQTHSFNLPNNVENSRGRGRGRGTKVYLQTEGSFLGQGPALKIKKEPMDLQYEKASYSRYPSKGGSKMNSGDIKIDSSKINELLECYDQKEVFFEEQNTHKPVRLPFVKLERTFEIKKEITEEQDIKPIIKKEFPAEDKWSPLEGKFFTRIKQENIDMPEDLKLFQDKKSLILIQFPACLPFEKITDLTSQEKSTASKLKNAEKEENSQEQMGACLRDVTEGCIGKLQIMKSGRMQIIMGSIIMVLEHGADSETLSEAVSIPIADKEEGDLISLGPICEKMVLRPSLHCMLKEKENEDSEMDKFLSREISTGVN